MCVCVCVCYQNGELGACFGVNGTQEGLCRSVHLFAREMLVGQASQLPQGKHFHVPSELELLVSLIDQVPL